MLLPSKYDCFKSGQNRHKNNHLSLLNRFTLFNNIDYRQFLVANFFFLSQETGLRLRSTHTLPFSRKRRGFPFSLARFVTVITIFTFLMKHSSLPFRAIWLCVRVRYSHQTKRNLRRDAPLLLSCQLPVRPWTPFLSPIISIRLITNSSEQQLPSGRKRLRKNFRKKKIGKT